MNNLVEIAKSCGSFVRSREVEETLIPVTAEFTTDELHAYTEQVCKQMVDALTATIEGTLIDEVNRDEDSIYGVWNRLDSGLDSDYLHMHIKAIKKALAAHKEMMGDLYE